MNNKFTILITTKNRKDDLAITLANIKYLIENGVECIICDDGSNDGTVAFLQAEYPNIQLIQNKKSQGLIYSRNRLLNLTKTEFVISLDDDAHFVTENPLELIANHFEQNSTCGLIALRIFWGLEKPKITVSNEEISRVRGFVGCGHVWRMEAWKSIPNYPEWFVFYGEEDFAAYQLFKKKWEIHYLPEVLVNHRVDIKARKNEKDYRLRLRRSLRSGWYLYLIFYPWREIPRRFTYTLWVQIKNKVLKGDWRAMLAIIQAMGDVIINLPRLLKNSNRLTANELEAYSNLPVSKLYWTPVNIQNTL
ncbi:MAG: glycosyltransferase family 2 protein [Lutibacter sp.]|nr:glycosyltransferase family 2 protein [Lutibacter sp.]